MIVSAVLAVMAGASDFRQGWEDGAETPETTAFGIVRALIILGGAVVYLYAFACFVRFILCVNHGEVFNWINVDLLRTVGWCIVVTTTVMCSVISFSSINLLDAWTDGISIIADGVFILIMAEVFSIGLKLKEEQDLTI
jgi:hypothetical protein